MEKGWGIVLAPPPPNIKYRLLRFAHSPHPSLTTFSVSVIRPTKISIASLTIIIFKIWTNEWASERAWKARISTLSLARFDRDRVSLFFHACLSKHPSKPAHACTRVTRYRADLYPSPSTFPSLPFIFVTRLQTRASLGPIRPTPSTPFVNATWRRRSGPRLGLPRKKLGRAFLLSSLHSSPPPLVNARTNNSSFSVYLLTVSTETEKVDREGWGE